MVEETRQEVIQRKPTYIEDLEKGIFDALFFSKDDREKVIDTRKRIPVEGVPDLTIPNPTFGLEIENPNFGQVRRIDPFDPSSSRDFSGLLGGIQPRIDTRQFILDNFGNEIPNPNFGKQFIKEDLFRLPDFQVAPLDKLQTDVLTTLASEDFRDRAEEYFGKPTDESGIADTSTPLGQARTTLGGVTDYLQRVIPKEKSKGLGEFDPSTQTMEFFNPFRKAVIDESIKEIDRQAALARIVDDAKAVQAGTFGGSRSGVQRAETAKRVQEAKNKTISDLLSKGYDFAQQQAMKADEIAKNRALNAAKIAAGVGSAQGSLAGTEADIGRVYSTLRAQDLATKSAAGAQRQALEQTKLDAERGTALLPLQEVLAPLSIGQKFVSGSPSAGSLDQFTRAVEPSPNPFLQGIGAAATLQGLYK